MLRRALLLMGCALPMAGLAMSDTDAAPVLDAPSVQMIMFEQAGCYYCAQWNKQIGPIYPKTEVGQYAPLERRDIGDKLPDAITMNGAIVFTPTFVVLQDSHELFRIEGYASEDFFWALLEQNLSQRTSFHPTD